MDEYTQQLEMQLRFAEEEAQERERIAYENGKDDGYNQALEDVMKIYNEMQPQLATRVYEFGERIERLKK